MITLLYLAIGLAVAFRFATVTAARFTERAEVGSFPFRLFLIPGAIVLWPLVLHIDWRGVASPPLHYSYGAGSATEASILPKSLHRPASVGDEV